MLAWPLASSRMWMRGAGRSRPRAPRLPGAGGTNSTLPAPASPACRAALALITGTCHSRRQTALQKHQLDVPHIHGCPKHIERVIYDQR
jgi:hypothetical protein